MRALDECNSIGATFMHYENDDYSELTATPPQQIRSLVLQPSTWVSNAVSDSNTATAAQHIHVDIGEINYKWMFLSDDLRDDVAVDRRPLRLASAEV